METRETVSVGAAGEEEEDFFVFGEEEDFLEGEEEEGDFLVEEDFLEGDFVLAFDMG